MTVTIEWMLSESRTAPEGGDSLATTYGILDIDAVLSETYDNPSEATEHPVEQGAEVTDHYYKKLSHVTLECVVSNHPIGPTREHLARIEAVDLELPSVTQISRGALRRQRSETEERHPNQGVQVLRFDDDFDRCQEVYDQLVELQNSKTPVDVIGARFGDLENYLIKNVSVPVENDNSITFTIDFQELRTAVTQEVDAPSPRVERGRRRRNRGRQPATEESEENPRRTGSAARNAIDSLAGVNLPQAGGGS